MENKMQIEYLSPGALIPSPHNARIHPPEQIQAIADNIRENGFLRPVLIDGENGIIGGHGGVEAAKLLELPEIPCVRADHLIACWLCKTQGEINGERNRTGHKGRAAEARFRL